MLNQMTLNRLHEMKLSAMAEKYRTIAASAAEGQLSFDEWFGLLVDAEWDHRHTNRIARLMKKATLYFPNASVEDIEYRSDRKLNRNLLQELGTCRYILDKRNVILMGATGAGKTYIACALGTAACRNLYTVKYIRLPDLLNELAVLPEGLPADLGRVDADPLDQDGIPRFVGDCGGPLRTKLHYFLFPIRSPWLA